MTKVVVLGGGYGRRLRPWSLIAPKALIPLHPCPLLRIRAAVPKEIPVTFIYRNINSMTGPNFVDDLIKHLDPMIETVSFKVDGWRHTIELILTMLKNNSDTEDIIIVNGDLILSPGWFKVIESNSDCHAIRLLVGKGGEGKQLNDEWIRRSHTITPNADVSKMNAIGVSAIGVKAIGLLEILSKMIENGRFSDSSSEEPWFSFLVPQAAKFGMIEISEFNGDWCDVGTWRGVASWYARHRSLFRGWF